MSRNYNKSEQHTWLSKYTSFYLFFRKNTVDFIKTQDSLKNEVELVGSWTVNVGDQDQALHLWKFTGGFEKIDDYNKILGKSEVSDSIFMKVIIIKSKQPF